MKRPNKPWTGPQKKALEESIEHWEKIVAGEADSIAGQHCACCLKYYRRSSPCGRHCRSCPVAVFTGEAGCLDTPWHSIARHPSVISSAIIDLPEDLKKRCEKELAYLKKVLKAGS